MANLITRAAVVIAIAFGAVSTAPLTNISDSKAHACGQRPSVACGLTAPEKKFSGTKKVKNPIKVTVCHTYWDRLDIGHLNGRKTKWWGPTIRYGRWHADLPATANQCKTWWVKPGTIIDSFASCVHRVIRTPRMTRAGTYWLK